MSCLDDGADGVDGETRDGLAGADPLEDALRNLRDGAEVGEDLRQRRHTLRVEVVLQRRLHVHHDLVYTETWHSLKLPLIEACYTTGRV